MRPIYVNTKILQYHTTGVQRYLLEMMNQIGSSLTPLQPDQRREGIRGHLWEQTVLAARTSRGVLWSPANTGPLLHPRQVVTLHDIAVLEHPEWFGSGFAKVYQALIPRLAHRARQIIAVSQFTKDRIVLTTNVPEEKVVVIYNAADPRFKPASPAAIALVAQRLNLPFSHYVLSLGSLEPRKNLQRLLQAWHHIASELPSDVGLVVAGGLGKSAVFGNLDLPDSTPRVFFTGRVPDEWLPALYSGALLMVYPSLYEGFGLPPLEAMSTGTAVITSNQTSLPEVVGDAAWMVNPLDTLEIAEAIKTLVLNESERKRLAQAGLKRSRLFSWEQAAKQTWTVLRTVAEE